MAQTSGWLIIARSGFKRVAFLAALKEVKLRSFVTPGAALEVSAKIIHEGSGFTVTSADIKSSGKLVCNAEMTFRVMAFPAGNFLTSMQEVAERIGLPMNPASHESTHESTHG
jgi:3-hydroxyacyl-[acyl-carrier-protein] dehydratase